MNLYKSTSRFLKSYDHLKKKLKRPPTFNEFSKIDHLHYNGTDAVNYAIIKTKIDANSCVLDIGSGVGGPARYIANNTNAIIYAVEIQKDLNNIAKILTKEFNLKKKIKHIQNDFLKLSLKDIKFDSVVSWLALYHIPDRDKLFKKIYSLLKLKGYFYTEDFFLIDELNKKENAELSKAFHANYLVNYKQYLNDLETQKFEIISHRDMTIDWSSFTKKRLQDYKKDFDKNVLLYGAIAAKNILKFYEFAYKLFISKKIGGIRLLCRKYE